MMDEKNGTSNKKKQNKNKFMKLLILLGIIFFLYIMQDVLHLRPSKNKGVIETEESKSRLEMPNVAKSDSQQVVEEIKNELSFDFVD